MLFQWRGHGVVGVWSTEVEYMFCFTELGRAFDRVDSVYVFVMFPLLFSVYTEVVMGKELESVKEEVVMVEQIISYVKFLDGSGYKT